MERSTMLARVSDRGFARVCPSGCIHVSYGPVTLDFARDSFEQFATTIGCARARRSEAVVDVQYDRATLRFTGEEFGEFAALVADAQAQLARLNRHANWAPKEPRPRMQ